jgi:hypothetical protein
MAVVGHADLKGFVDVKKATFADSPRRIANGQKWTARRHIHFQSGQGTSDRDSGHNQGFALAS